MIHTFVVLGFSEFQLEFSVVGFLSSILPWRSLATHRNEYLLCSEELEHQVAGILWSLIWVKYIRYSASCFADGILDSCQNKFLGMYKWESVSNNFFAIFINDSCEVEVYSLADNMSKITSPYHIWCYRAEMLGIVGYLWGDGESILSDDSNLFPMHIFLF